MRLWIIPVLLLLVIGCDALPKREYKSAEKKWVKGDYLGALKGFEKIVEDHPESSVADDAYYWIGQIYYLHLREPRKALESFSIVVTKYPGSPYLIGAQEKIAEIQEKELTDYRQAIVEYQKLADISFDQEVIKRAYYKIGEVYFKMGDYEQARTEWDVFVKKYPKGSQTEEALFRIASTYFIEGRHREAINAYKVFLDTFPQSELALKARFDIASSWEEEGNLEKALEGFKEIEDLYPNKDAVRIKIRAIEERISLSADR